MARLDLRLDLDITKFAARIAEDIREQTRRILDGITIHMMELPSWPRFVEACNLRDQFEQHSLLYRMIRPLEWRRRRLAVESARAALQIELINATLERGEELMARPEGNGCQP